jgi:hypothetical protein
MPMMTPASTAAQIQSRGNSFASSRNARNPRTNSVWTTTAVTRPRVSVSGRDALNQKSGATTATRAASDARGAVKPTAIQNSVMTKAASAPAITPQNASPAAAR